MSAIFANDPGLPALSRRRLLHIAPVAAVGLATSAVAPHAAPQEGVTPIRALFLQWKEYNAWLGSSATDGMPEDEFDAAVDVRTNRENQMIETPAEDAADVLMMIAAYADFGIGDVSGRHHLPKLWDQVCAILGEGGAA